MDVSNQFPLFWMMLSLGTLFWLVGCINGMRFRRASNRVAVLSYSASDSGAALDTLDER